MPKKINTKLWRDLINRFAHFEVNKEKCMKLKKIALATLLAVSATVADAGSFVTLGKGDGTTLTPGNGGIKNGTTNPNTDIYYISVLSATYVPGMDNTNVNGNTVATTINYEAFNRVGSNNVTTGTGTLKLLDWRVTTGVDLAPNSKQADIFDFVYQDTADNTLVFATRYLNRVANFEEANYLYRYNFSTTAGYQPGVAWTFSSDDDLRMYQAALTNSISLNNTAPYTVGVVRQKGDFSLSEGNPWSGLFLVKSDAKAFSLKAGAIGFAQAGEESQVPVRGSIAGYAATNFSSGVAQGEKTYVYGGAYGSNNGTTNVAGEINVKSDTTFNGSVVAASGSHIAVDAGSQMVFNGAFSQRVGALLDGGGTFQFNGGYSPGNSPGSVTVNGNVIFGASNEALFEIAGTALGAEYDHLTVNGVLTFGGALNISFLNGFTASAGQTFDLFDFTSATGTFSSINFTNAALGTGLVWDTSNLYANGTISVASVTAVPEPESYALMMLGLSVIAMVRRQKKQA
jgi:hypothetical protein